MIGNNVDNNKNVFLSVNDPEITFFIPINMSHLSDHFWTKISPHKHIMPFKYCFSEKIIYVVVAIKRLHCIQVCISHQ